MSKLRDRVAAKRLAAVEVQPSASHQHEFNAGMLRKELGFGDARLTAPLTVLYHTRDGEPPTIEETTYTLYDAREQHPSRTEWRLYYRSDLLPRIAREGDLLLVFRPPDTDALRAVVARSGTDAARQLQHAVMRDESDVLRGFVFSTPEPPSSDTSARVVETLVQRPTADVGYDVRESLVFRNAVAANELPNTAQMAEAAQDIVREVRGNRLAADELLDHALAAETALYYAIENEIGTRRLERLYELGKPEFARVLEFAMSIHQSRRSRRGRSLESHFAVLLERENIPFNEPRTRAECTTEGGERPDFIVPGCTEYADRQFPTERLRMVACKSTERERWRQILREAERIREKYLLTVDEDLTDPTIREMRNAGLRPFLPKRVLDEAYAGRPSRELLGTVDELLGQLRAVL